MRLSDTQLMDYEVRHGRNLRATPGGVQGADQKRRDEYGRLFDRYMASTPGTAEARELLAQLRRLPPC